MLHIEDRESAELTFPSCGRIFIETIRVMMPYIAKMHACISAHMYLVTHYPVNSLNDIIQKLSHRNFPTNVIQCLVIGTDRDMTDQQRRIHFVSACSYHIESTWDDIYIHCTWVNSDRCCHGVSWSTRDVKCNSKIGYW